MRLFFPSWSEVKEGDRYSKNKWSNFEMESQFCWIFFYNFTLKTFFDYYSGEKIMSQFKFKLWSKCKSDFFTVWFKSQLGLIIKHTFLKTVLNRKYCSVCNVCKLLWLETYKIMTVLTSLRLDGKTNSVMSNYTFISSYFCSWQQFTRSLYGF